MPFMWGMPEPEPKQTPRDQIIRLSAQAKQSRLEADKEFEIAQHDLDPVQVALHKLWAKLSLDNARSCEHQRNCLLRTQRRLRRERARERERRAAKRAWEQILANEAAKAQQQRVQILANKAAQAQQQWGHAQWFSPWQTASWPVQAQQQWGHAQWFSPWQTASWSVQNGAVDPFVRELSGEHDLAAAAAARLDAAIAAAATDPVIVAAIAALVAKSTPANQLARGSA
jgi:hypothetical protein